MSEWQKYRFADIITEEGVSYGIVQPGFHKEFNSVPIIRVNNIKAGSIDIDDLMKVDEVIENKYSRTRLKGGELLITVVGSVGEAAVVPSELAGYNVARAVSVSRVKDAFDIQFIRYSLLIEDIKFQIYSHTNDTVQPTLNLSSLKEIVFNIPTLHVQQEISEALKSLDDKIDLLHRQNNTLEELAETLFRQWFVEEAEESWEEKGLDEIADFMNGLACQKYPVKPNEIGLPVIKIKELRTGITEASDKATKDVPDKYLVYDGDMLFSWSGSLDIVLWCDGNGVLNQHLFKVSSDLYPQWFYYYWTKYHLPEFKSIAEDKATTMGHIQRHHLTSAVVNIPPDHVIKRHDVSICPLFEKIKSNLKQIRTLTQLRDTLLPKLMSGEIKIEN